MRLYTLQFLDCYADKKILQVHHEALRDALSNFQNAVKKAKCQYYSNITEKYRQKPKQLFTTIDSALNPSKVYPIPSFLKGDDFDFFLIR